MKLGAARRQQQERGAAEPLLSPSAARGPKKDEEAGWENDSEVRLVGCWLLLPHVLVGLPQGLPQGPQQPQPLPSQVRRQQGVTAYVLDQSAARQWRDRLPP